MPSTTTVYSYLSQNAEGLILKTDEWLFEVYYTSDRAKESPRIHWSYGSYDFALSRLSSIVAMDLSSIPF